MKKEILFFFGLFVTITMQALTVVTTAGHLSRSVTNTGADLATISKLTITGTLDARDFKIMRDSMSQLSILDISDVTIVKYIGNNGTARGTNITYSANEIPENAFLNHLDSFKQLSLSDVTLIFNCIVNWELCI